MGTSTTSSADVRDIRPTGWRINGSGCSDVPLTVRSWHAYAEASSAVRSGRASGGQHMTTPAQEGGSAGGPTVLRILLGAHLRRLREAAGVTPEEARWEMRSSEYQISPVEVGRV